MNVEETLKARGIKYGDFSDHAKIAQALKKVMWCTPGWSKLSDDKCEALEMIQHKIARILNGDPNYTDNWHDVEGYAKLAEARCSKPKE